MMIHIDLLPQDKKNELKRKKTFANILRAQVLFLLPLLVFIVLLYNVLYVLNIHKDTASENNYSGEVRQAYQQLETYEDEFRRTNETVDILVKLNKGHLHWYDTLLKLSNATPQGIHVSNLSTKNFQIILLGKSETRDTLLTFKSELEKTDCFENVNVPLSNLVVKNDIDFQMDFSIKQECLKAD